MTKSSIADDLLNSANSAALNSIMQKMFELARTNGVMVCESVSPNGSYDIKERGAVVMGLASGLFASYLESCLPTEDANSANVQAELDSLVKFMNAAADHILEANKCSIRQFEEHHRAR